MKVFISYAREDWEIAEKVWSDLKRAGIDAWIDRKELLPGQNWKTEISKAIRASSHFIALLSTRSVSKQGFFHTELKKAIDVLDTFPEHRIYFIPVRIDDCEPGYERLGDIHWADLFPSYEEGLSQILRVLVQNLSEKPFEIIPIINKSANQPQVNKQKYHLRKEPISVSHEEAEKVFKVGRDEVEISGSKYVAWRPLEYIPNDFKDNGDGTITDYATDLMWQKFGSDKPMRYEDTKDYIERLNHQKFATYSNWRLPTVDELKSLIKKEKQSNKLYFNPIFDERQWLRWSSDKYVSDGWPDCWWYVSFYTGGMYPSLSDSSHYVRAVRSI